MDMQSQIHPTYSPRVALVYTPVPNHSLRVSYATAYRPPTLVQTHTDIKTTVTVFGFSVQNQFIGSSNLEPEQIQSYEAEYQGWYWDHRIRIRTALFHNEIKNLIGVGRLSPTQTSWANIPGMATIQGFEVGAEVIATTWLRGFANISNQHTHQSITGGDQRGGPTTMVNGGLQANLKNGLNGEAAVHFVGAGMYPTRSDFSQFASIGLIPQSAVPSSQVNSYTLVNLRAGYRFWHEKAEIAVSAFNALNDRHQEHPLGDTIGSRVMGWFTLSL